MKKGNWRWNTLKRPGWMGGILGRGFLRSGSYRAFFLPLTSYLLLLLLRILSIIDSSWEIAYSGQVYKWLSFGI
jgi:hypothetical protein